MEGVAKLALRSTWRVGVKNTYLDPFALFLGEHAFYDHFRLNGYTGKALEPKPYRTVELALRL